MGSILRRPTKAVRGRDTDLPSLALPQSVVPWRVCVRTVPLPPPFYSYSHLHPRPIPFPGLFVIEERKKEAAEKDKTEEFIVYVYSSLFSGASVMESPV